MSQGQSNERIADTIGVHWREEEVIRPPEDFVAQANMADPDIFKRMSEAHFPDCFDEYARLLDWSREWDRTLDDSNPPFFKWFVGGELNASVNCIDRHLEKAAERVAWHFIPESEEEAHEALSYGELSRRVNELASVLREDCGLECGDRVTLYLPMTLELPIAMLACARLGVIHSGVFSGYSGAACAERIVDSQSRVLITMDAYRRGGKLLDHKVKADEAAEKAQAAGCPIERMLVFSRYPGQYNSEAPMKEGRDLDANALVRNRAGATVAPQAMRAEDTLFLMYTSGTTGKPKGAQHSVGGYLAWVAATSKYVLDIKPEDTYWCMADIGWITGHSYIVYGPLALGTTSILYEGAPTTPDAGRPWRIAEQYGVNLFHTSPTAVRALRRADPELPKQFDLKFRAMTTVGEPIEPEAWRWYFEAIGHGRAVITDTWWQTENGGHLISTLPALHAMKPGSAGPALPGIHPVIFDEEGEAIPAGSGKAGNLCIRNPWPGRMLSIWGDDERFVKTYYARYNHDPKSRDWRDWPYLAGDGAVQSEDGFYRILGRIDDVINVAGHRLGTKELESACLTVAGVSEAAVVGVSDEVKGVQPEAFIALVDGAAPEKVVDAVKTSVTERIGPIARLRRVHVVPDLPKTRSGKIMRRILVALAEKRDPGNVATLANPEIVEAIHKQLAS
ncbi:MAG: acetate--CoA ligase [Gammaproteobacteria bacterium]|nr:acetate--CoA ligase [Gammaproteobacteria bacterium]